MRTTAQQGMTVTLLAVALAACSEGAGPELIVDETTLAADVATITALATVEDLGDMWLGSDVVGAPAGGIVRDHQRSRTVTFLGADGTEMDGYDPLLTASVVTVMEASASHEGDRWSGTMERRRETVLSGLEGEETERTWNGTGTDAVSRTRFDDGSGERSYTMSGQVTISDVVVGVPRSEHPWPLSGSITRHVVVTVVNGPNGDRTFERTAVVTFDGTRYATLDIDGEIFTLDLADRDGRRPRRGRHHRG